MKNRWIFAVIAIMCAMLSCTVFESGGNTGTLLTEVAAQSSNTPPVKQATQGQPKSSPTPTVTRRATLTRLPSSTWTVLPDTPTVTPTVEPSATPTFTPTPTQPAKQGLTPPTPTLTLPVPQASETLPPFIPAPTGFLSEKGPWLILPAEDGVFALNEDGTGFTRLTSQINSGQIVARQISPAGGYLAYIWAKDPMNYSGLELHLLHLPDLVDTKITPLQPDRKLNMDMGSADMEAARAMMEHSAFSWSPDGRKLAFIGAQDGVSADLYLYSLADKSIKRLTDGPSQGYQPWFSPDGKFILHAGAKGFGTGAGFVMTGVYAAPVDGGKVKDIYIPQNGDEIFAGWVNKTTFMVYTWNIRCGYMNLRTVDITNPKKVGMLWKDYFDTIAFDELRGTAMVSLSAQTAECNKTYIVPGGYWMYPGLDVVQAFGDPVTDMVWSKVADAFVVAASSYVKVIYPDGSTQDIKSDMGTVPVFAGKGSDMVAWVGELGVRVGKLNANLKTISLEHGDQAIWSADGQTLVFSDGSGLFAASAPDFTRVEVQAPFYLNTDQPVWMTP